MRLSGLPCDTPRSSDGPPPAKRPRAHPVLDSVSHAGGGAGGGAEEGLGGGNKKNKRGEVETSCAVYALVTCQRDAPGAVCCSVCVRACVCVFVERLLGGCTPAATIPTHIETHIYTHVATHIDAMMGAGTRMHARHGTRQQRVAKPSARRA